MALFLLTACSSYETSNSNDNSSENVLSDVDNFSEFEPDLVPEPEPEIVPEPEPVLIPEVKQTYLVEKKIGTYLYEGRSDGEIRLGNYPFTYSSAAYSYDGLGASVYVLHSNPSINHYSYLKSLLDEKKVLLLDSNNFDSLDQDVYYNPFENEYIWLSGDNLLLVEDVIGTSVLNRYFKEYPVSIVGNVFDKEFALKLRGEDNSLAVFFNSKQYSFLLENIDHKKNLASISLNGFAADVAEEDTLILNNLLLEIVDIDFVDDIVELRVKEEISDFKSLELELGNPISFELGSQTNTIEITDFDEDDSTAEITLNGLSKFVAVGETLPFDIFSMKIKKILINNLGDVNVFVFLDIWLSE